MYVDGREVNIVFWVFILDAVEFMRAHCISVPQKLAV